VAKFALDAIADMSGADYGIRSSLGGTIPFAARASGKGAKQYLNRAWVLTPEGAPHAAGFKLSLTPLGKRRSRPALPVHVETIKRDEWNGLAHPHMIHLSG